VPTRLGALARQAYLPSAFGVGAVALVASAGNRMFDGAAPRAMLLVLLVLGTMALLFGYGVVFVIERDDKNLAWARVKGWLSMRRTV
jgi:hypothetical protein